MPEWLRRGLDEKRAFTPVSDDALPPDRTRTSTIRLLSAMLIAALVAGLLYGFAGLWADEPVPPEAGRPQVTAIPKGPVRASGVEHR